MAVKCDKTAMKNINVGSILRIVKERKTVSQTDLVHLTGLQKATVSNLVNSLKSNRLLVEVGESSSGKSGGRKQILLSLNADRIVALGAAIRGQTLQMSLVTLSGQILWSSETQFPRNHSTLWLPVVVEHVKRAIKETITSDHVLLGLGVAAGGLYDASTHCFIRLSNQDEQPVPEKNIPVRSLLQEKLPELRIITDDLPNAMAMGELWYGSATEVRDFVFLQLTNLKATVVTNQTIFRGYGRYAGQVGGMRYGSERLRDALKHSNFSTTLIADFCTDMLLCYAPERVVISRENIPPKVEVDVVSIIKILRDRFEEFGMTDEHLENLVTLSTLGFEERGKAVSSLVFDNYFNANILS